MGKRFGFPDTDEAVAELSLAEIESEISRCALGHKIGGSSLGRKSFFKQPVWLESQREELHGIPAP